jgi:hypothetical protein
MLFRKAWSIKKEKYSHPQYSPTVCAPQLVTVYQRWRLIGMLYNNEFFLTDSRERWVSMALYGGLYSLCCCHSLKTLTCCHNTISMDYSTISEGLDAWLINFSASCLTTGLLCTINTELCHIKYLNSYKNLVFDLIKCIKKWKSIHAIHTQLIQCRYFKGVDVFAGHLKGNRRPNFGDLSCVDTICATSDIKRWSSGRSNTMPFAIMSRPRITFRHVFWQALECGSNLHSASD